MSGYYGFWIWAWLLIGYQLIWEPRRFARQLGKRIQFTHHVSSAWVLLLWAGYPVCWGISEGGNVISPDSEFIFYGVLDCCLIPITAAFFLTLHWAVQPDFLGLRIRTYDDPWMNSRAGTGDKHIERNGNDTVASGAQNADMASAQDRAAAEP